MNGKRAKRTLGAFTGKRSTFRKLVSLSAALTLSLPPQAFPAQIVPDGRTGTSLTIRDNVTDVTTSTVRGANAYNSFQTFDVYRGNVVNLHVPDSAVNLLNLVHGQASTIDGILNAYKDGRIGGNVFFANPYGFLVGASGSVNVGALSVMTPTTSFMESFFLAPGVPSESAAAMMLNGTVPINPDGLISIRGQINALGTIRLSGGSVVNSGTITSTGTYGTAADTGSLFRAMVNADGLESGNNIVARNGGIEIVAAQSVENYGSIYSKGQSLHLQAGTELIVADGETISTRKIEGDPSDAAVHLLTDNSSGNSGNLTLEAPTITLGSGARLLTHASGDYLAGNIELLAGQNITLNNGARLLAGHASDPAKGGDVLLKVSAINAIGASRTADAGIRAVNSVIRGRNVTLSSIADTSLIVHLLEQNPTLSLDEAQAYLNSELDDLVSDGPGGEYLAVTTSATAKTELYGTTIEGTGAVTIEAKAGARAGFKKNAVAEVIIDDLRDADQATVLAKSYIRGNKVSITSTADTSLTFNVLGSVLKLTDQSWLPDPVTGELQLLNDQLFDFSEIPLVSLSTATAHTTVGGATFISAGDTLTISSEGISAAKPTFSSPLLFSAAWGESTVEAKTLVNGTTELSAANKATVKATTDVEINVTADVNSTNKPVDAVFVHAKNTAVTTSLVGNDTTTTAGAVEVNAAATADISANALAKNAGGSGVGIAVAVNESTTTTTATLGGNVTADAGNVTVKATTDITKNNTGADAATLGNPNTISARITNFQAGIKRNVTKGIIDATGLLKPETSERITGFIFPGIKEGTFNLSGAVTYSKSVNTTTAAIAPDATVQAQGNIDVTARIDDRPNASVGSKATSTGTAIGGAAVIADFTNNASASIGTGASVDATGSLLVDAQTVVPYPWQIDWDSPVTILNHLQDGILDLLLTSYAINSAGGKSGMGLAAAVSVFNLENNANAWIDEGARINTVFDKDAMTLPNQTVTVHAKNDISTVNAVGLLSKKFLGTSGGKAAIGGSGNIIDIRENATATIRGDSVVKSESTIDVKAENVNHLVTVTEAGGSSDQVGVEGAVSINTITGGAVAAIDDDADVDAGGNISVEAKGTAKTISVAGGVVATKGQVGIGFAVSLNTIDTDASAYIGNYDPLQQDDVPALGQVSTDGSLTVKATSSNEIGAYSVTGALATNSTAQTEVPKDAQETKDGAGSVAGSSGSGKGTFGIAVSGDASVNDITSDTLAYISDGATVSQAGNATLSATNTLAVNALAGAVTISTQQEGNGLAGSYSQNTLGGTTAAYLDDASLTISGDLDMDAQVNGEINTISASVQGTKGKVGVAGSVSVNEITNTTQTYLTGSTVRGVEAVDLTARDDSIIKSIAGAVSYGGKAGIGLSFAWNSLDNLTQAYVDTSALTATGDITVSATTNNAIDTISAALGASTGDMAGEAAVSVNTLSNETHAWISGQNNGSGVESVGSISLAADDQSRIFAIAGGLAATSGKAAFGLSFAWSDVSNIVDAGIRTGADVESTSGNVEVAADSTTRVQAFAVGGSFASKVGIGGSVSVAEGTNSVTATIDGTSGVTADGNVLVTASDDVDIFSLAGNVAGAGSAAIAVANSTLVTHNLVEATLGAGATVSARGNGTAGRIYTGDKDASGNRTKEDVTGLAVSAASFENLQTIAAGGAGGGKVGIAGSATVTVLDEKTYATVGQGAHVNDADDGDAAQNVLIRASDRTGLLGVAGAVAFGGSGGVGAGADVGVITKDTEASIASSAQTPTTVKAKGNIVVTADSSEDITSVAASLSAGGSAGIAGSASVYDLGLNTAATIGNSAVVRADGSVAVSAHDGTEMDMIAGNGAFGGTAGVGASAAVQVITKTVIAAIGEQTDVTGRGTGDGVVVADGGFAVSYGADSGDEGEIRAPTTNGSGSDSGALTGQRSAPPSTRTVNGVAVTATNQDDIESISATGSIAGTAAITLAGNVNAITTTTSATIGTGATVNQDTAAADAGQSVLVAAGNDYYHMGVAGSGSGAGAVGIGVGADVTVANLTTTADIGEGALVSAAKDVEVSALAGEEVLSISASLGVAGTVGVSGSVSVLSIDNTTSAGTGTDSMVDAGGNVRIAARDDTETDMIAGTVAIGIGGAGVGGAVGVTSVSKETTATVGSNATVNARGNDTGSMTAYTGDDSDTTGQIRGLSVEAASSEDIFSVAAAGAGGFYAGVSGAVTVQTVDSATRASIGTNASVNEGVTDGHDEQDVNVSARNSARTNVITGALGVGALGAAGGVDVGAIRNDTSASIADGAQIYANRDVEVNALAKTEIDSVVVSAAGGLGAIAGGVAVYSVGTGLEQEAKDQLKSDGGDFADVNSYADDQASDNSIGTLLTGSGDSRIRSIAADAQAKRSDVAVTDQLNNQTPRGTAAFIGGAAVEAGRHVDVSARRTVDADILAGAAAGGALGLGAGIGIVNVSGSTQAYILGSGRANAAGNILVSANTDATGTVDAYVGTGGIVAVNAALAIYNDTASTSAYLGDGGVIDRADQVDINATGLHTVTAHTFGVSAGAAAGGLSLAKARVGGTIDASVGEDTRIGQDSRNTGDTVGSLSVSAQTTTNGTARSEAAAGGILSGQGSIATADIGPTVTAEIGNRTAARVDTDVAAMATATVTGTATANGASIGALGVGVSEATARTMPVVRATIGDETVITAGQDVTVSGTATTTATTHATASAGALIGIAGTTSTATGLPQVNTAIGSGSTIEADRAVSVTATTTNSASSDASGWIGGLAAFGSNTATAVTAVPLYDAQGRFISWFGSTTGALIGGNTAITTDSVNVAATSSNVALADSRAGAGGGIAGVTTRAETIQVNTTTAAIADSSDDNARKIHATNSIAITADALTTLNAFADSSTAGLVGVSGARTDNAATSVVEASVGTNNALEAGTDLAVLALNEIVKYSPQRPANLTSGAGGVFGGAAGQSSTSLSTFTTATLAGNTISGSDQTISAGGDLTVAAENAVLATDMAQLSAGGLIAVADVRSAITSDNTATATIGANANVHAGNDLNVLAKTNANVQTTTNTSTWGFAAGGDGTALNTVVADNDVVVGTNAALSADNDIDLFAGQGLSDLQNSLISRADARSWVSGAIPVSDVTGWAYLYDFNDILIDTGSNLKAGRDINLGAFSGLATVEGYAKAKKKSYLLFGIPITIYSNGSRRSWFFNHEGTDVSGPSVTVNGTLESGLNRHKTLVIGPDGTVVGGTLTSADYEQTTINLRDKVLDKKAKLDAKIAEIDPSGTYPNLPEGDKILYDALKTEVQILEQKLAEWEGKSNAELTVPLIAVKDLMTGSGDINITTTTLKGTGTLKVPGTDFMIRIDNNSLAHLELNDLEIPKSASGNVNLNGKAITSHSYGGETLQIVAGQNLGRRIEIFNNAYLDDFPGALTPSDIVLKGDIINYGGRVSIRNNSGSVAVGGNIIADDLDMVMQGGFVREWQPGLYQPGHLIAGNNIYISGEILDINDTIQSGIPYRYITIPEFDPETLGPDMVIPTIGDELSVAKWDPVNQRIVIYRVDFGGGKVELFGNIVSTTGTGALKVMDGYGEIVIENLSSRDVVINTLDVGPRVDGQIKIVDTGRKYTDNGIYVGDNNQLLTLITGNGDALNVSQGYQLWDAATRKFIYTELDSHKADSRSSSYAPHAGARVATFSDWTITEKDVAAAWDNWWTTRFTAGNFWLQFALMVDAGMKQAILDQFGKKADNPIGIEFLGNLDEGRISIFNSGAAGPSDIYLNGSIRNTVGNVSIRNDRGGIYSLNDTYLVTGRNIALTATEGSIGTLDQGIRTDTVGGSLRATAGGLINVEEVEGDLVIDTVTTTGDVRLVSAGSLRDGSGTSPSITGTNISLTATAGGIGTGDNALVVNADGILTAESLHSIYLTEKEGNAHINRIASREGDVVLTVDGGLEDYNFNEGLDDDTKDKLLTTWDDLKLTDDTKVQQSIDQYKEQKKSQYQAAHRLSDNGTPFDPSDDQYDATYDPSWQYTLTATEQSEFNEGVWTADELLNAKNLTTIPELGKTEVLIEEANVSGRNVTIVTGAGVGSVLADEVISADAISNGTVTPDQRIMVARAEKDDITIDNGNLIVQLKNDVDVRASQSVTIQSRDHVYLGAETDVNIDRVDAGNGDIRLKIVGGIINGRTDDEANLIGRDLILEASAGGVGSAARPLVTDLSLGGVLTARARDGIFIREAGGDISADSIISQNGAVELTVANGSAAIGQISAPGHVLLEVSGNIVNGRDDNGVNIIGDDLIIESSAGGAGTSANALVTDLSGNGVLTAWVRDDLFLEERNGDLTIDTIASTNGAVELSVAAGSAIVGGITAPRRIRMTASANIVNGRDDGRENLITDDLSLEAAGGSVGSAEKFIVSRLRPAGILTGLSQDSFFLKEQGGGLTVDSVVSQTGSVHLTVPDGSVDADHISAPGTVSIRANGPLLTVHRVDPTVLDVRNTFSGGTIVVGQADVAESVMARSDTVLLGEIHHTGSGTLHFDVDGGSKTMADMVRIGTDSNTAIDFDHLSSDTAVITADVDNLSLFDTRIGNRGDFSNSLYHVIVGNRDKRVRPCHLQLYATEPFSLTMTADKRFTTTAFAVNYDPHFVVNGFSTENSVVGTTEKMIWTGKRQNRLYYDPMEPGSRPWQRHMAPSGHDAVDIQPGAVGIDASDSLLEADTVKVLTGNTGANR
ncbi:leukotoxin LktA family filamentous adhesin [Geobacter sulfurreducens]|uniref:leukotoxin LktA family filamentous adhesin n=1 Tax=Geobacter sulfurreducens TaxID=35554 RepID=UPI0020B748A2|nr:leukotoxin LktA family filamentous adhesin [Geobacter sulfurreducens]UTG93830.1 leukotoxin LktA family filamentous adhesin [Geobacter sulfurreducens]